MFKAIIFISFLIIFAESCQAPGKQEVTVRDTTITRENAFSELFLDSADLEKFILQQQLADSMANRMRSFYNSRNYQFAWFTNDGLAEQAQAFGTSTTTL